MTHALVSDLVAIIRCSLEGTGRPLVPALARALEGSAFPTVAAELEEIARRARASGATDEELALSIGAVLALAHAGTS